MKILKGAITSLASEGRITVQIPQYDIWVNMEPMPDPDRWEEVPDEWLITLKGGIPVVGKQKGFLFLTKVGWEVNKEKIKQAFEQSQFKRGTWDQFEHHAKNHFDTTKRKILQRIKADKKKVKQLKEALKQL